MIDIPWVMIVGHGILRSKCRPCVWTCPKGKTVIFWSTIFCQFSLHISNRRWAKGTADSQMTQLLILVISAPCWESGSKPFIWTKNHVPCPILQLETSFVKLNTVTSKEAFPWKHAAYFLIDGREALRKQFHICAPPAASNLEQQVLHLIQLTAVIGNFKTRLEHLVPASDPPILSMLDGFEETPQKEATYECCPKTILMIHDDDEKTQDVWEFNKCVLQLSLKYVADGIAKSLSPSSDGEFRSWSQGFGSDESGCIAAVASKLSHSNRSHPLRSRWHLAGKPLLRIWSLEHVLLMCTAGAYGMCYHHCSTVAATAFELFHCCFLLGMLCSCFIQFLAQVIVLGCGGKSHQGQWNATLAFTACLESLDVCFALLLGRPADIYCIL